MVHILNKTDWEIFRDHAEKVRQGLYRIIDEMHDEKTIRIVAGRFGYEETFSKDSRDLKQLLDWLGFHQFVQIKRSENADFFLR